MKNSGENICTGCKYLNWFNKLFIYNLLTYLYLFDYLGGAVVAYATAVLEVPDSNSYQEMITVIKS